MERPTPGIRQPAAVEPTDDRDGTVVAKVVGRSDLVLLIETIETILDGRVPDSVNRAGFQPQPVDLGTP